MKLEIKIHGHQSYRSVVGTALSWGQTVELFGGKFMSVPSVTLQTKGAVEVIPLRQELYWNEIKVIGEEAEEWNHS